MEEEEMKRKTKSLRELGESRRENKRVRERSIKIIMKGATVTFIYESSL
jgi:hypothetical protein